MTTDEPRDLIVELCRHLYTVGWASGTGGGISLRDGARVYMAPSGVQKERLQPDDVFVLDLDGRVLEGPRDARLRVSECAPLFFNAFRLRDAGAVLHSHSIHALLATLVDHDELRVTELEMIKGIRGHGYHDELVVPIIENTARERDLARSMADAMERYPETQAVLVRRHGVYVWGRDWIEAKTQAECYDYLFEAASRMRELGIDPSRRSAQETSNAGSRD
jgi:methylthioribulose-1-phosphate dehydratase